MKHGWDVLPLGETGILPFESFPVIAPTHWPWEFLWWNCPMFNVGSKKFMGHL